MDDLPTPGPPPHRFIIDPDGELARALELVRLVRYAVDRGEAPATLAQFSLELCNILERLNEWLEDGNSPPKAWPLASSLLLVRSIGIGEA
jgi:hypothetical protein